MEHARARNFATMHSNGRVLGYSANLMPGTPVSAAKAFLLQDFPSDAWVARQGRRIVKSISFYLTTAPRCGESTWVFGSVSVRRGASHGPGGGQGFRNGLATTSGAGSDVQCSPRQAEILALVARGFSDKQIAQELQLSPHTVRSYLDRFLHDHGLANRTAAAVAWLNVTEGARSHSSRPAVAHRGDARSR